MAAKTSGKGQPAKLTLDKDLDKLSYVEEAARLQGRRLIRPGLALLFFVICAIITAAQFVGQTGEILLVASILIGAYLAINIGANDVANNMGPAVGARALTMTRALIIAAFCESAGALIAGSNVVDTIAQQIVARTDVNDPQIFVLIMLSALLAAALWINVATWIGTPISTTHSIIGAIVGAGAVAAGLSSINWPVVASIAASWMVSPLLAAMIAAAFLAFIQINVVHQEDKIAAAKKWVPILIALMVGLFTAYLAEAAFRHFVQFNLILGLSVGALVGGAAWSVVQPIIERQASGLENRNQSVRLLFAFPLTIAAAMLSFAHGANDVANVVGPLAAIVDTVLLGKVPATFIIPFWVIIVGAVGISLGLLLFGPRLIRMVGREITRLNPMRAFCVALATAATVLIAAGFGLPVSSTHTAIGGVFGVGFLREWYMGRIRGRRLKLRTILNETSPVPPDRDEYKRRLLVRRSHFMTIVAAWLVTLPIAGLLAGLIYMVLDAAI